MKRRPTASAYTRPEVAAVRTGEHCPHSGWWAPLMSDDAGDGALARFVGEGSVMPAFDGTSTAWLAQPARAGSTVAAAPA